ncbi:MAG: ATP-binding protein, partial [Candidatus Omnitrophota bacterium]
MAEEDKTKEEMIEEIKLLQKQIAQLEKLDIQHKQAEEVLGKNVNKFRILFESSRDAIMTLEPPYWAFTSANPATVRMFLAKNEEEFISYGPWSLSPERQPDGRISVEKSGEMIEAAIREGSHFFEWTHKRINGEVFPCTVLLTCMEVDGGKIVQATVRDITEQKKEEGERNKILKWQQDVNTLQQSLLAPVRLENKLKSITDNIVRIFKADFCRIWLIRQGDLCERGCVHAKAQEESHICRYRDKCLHLMSSSGRYTHIDGQVHGRVPFGCYKIGRVASGDEHKFLTNDVVNDPIVYNHEWARSLGLVSFAGYQLRIPSGETLGVLALFSTHPILSAEDATLDSLSTTTAFVVQQAIADNNLGLQAQLMNTALKESLESRDTLAIMLTENNKIRTKLEESLEKLKEAHLQLVHAEKMEAVGRMASGVAHEVKNPLGIILQGVNYLEGALPLEQKDSRQMLQMMKESIKRADNIVHALLDFSRTEELKIDLQDINNIIESSIVLVRNKLKHSSIELIFELGKNLPKVPANKEKMEQVFVNLFDNAMDAMPKGGKLYIRSYLSGEKAVIVEVEDTGLGIDKDVIGKVFDPFFTTKNRAEGTGLGLSIVKSIVEMHKGLISVESKRGEGAKFTIVLGLPKLGDNMMKKKVMIVDDERDFLKITKLNLESTGKYEVETIPEAKDVLPRIKSASPDIILLDILMPKMDGVELCKRLNE